MHLKKGTKVVLNCPGHWAYNLVGKIKTYAQGLYIVSVGNLIYCSTPQLLKKAKV
jgi:hypothetical protein